MASTTDSGDAGMRRMTSRTCISTAPNPASSTSCRRVVASHNVYRKRQLVAASALTWRAIAAARAA
jgi:hypothetical protein